MSKKKQTADETRMENKIPKIRARIIEDNKGLVFLPQVLAIRMLDEGVNVLIMEDYVPTLGGIIGSVAFLTPEGEVRFDNIEGFYKHQHNEFTLLIQSRKEVKVVEETAKVNEKAEKTKKKRFAKSEKKSLQEVE